MTGPLRRISKRLAARPNPTSVVGSERDIDVLASIAEAGYLTTPQIARLHFTGRRRAQMRLRDLRDHRLVRAHVPGGALDLPNVVTVTPRGLALLEEEGRLEPGERAPGRCPTLAKLRHGVAIRDVFLAFEMAARGRAFDLTGFLFEGALQTHPVFQAVGLIPDALAVVRRGEERVAIGVEVDLATESLRLVAAKLDTWRRVAEVGARALGCERLELLVTAPGSRRAERLEQLAAGARVDARVIVHADLDRAVRTAYSLPPIAPPDRAVRSPARVTQAVFADAPR